MRFVLTIIFIGLFAALNAQALADLEKRLSLLDKEVMITYDTTGFSTLPKVAYLCNDHFNAYEFPENKKVTYYYHVIDLNNDGLKDLIYSGPCLPYDQTGIFLSDGKTLKLIHDYPGKLVSIEKKVGKTIINILKKPCCCDPYSDYIQVTVHNDSHVDKHQITFEGNTEVRFDRLTELKIKGILRTTPDLNDKEGKDICTDQVTKGNHLAYIEKPTKVIQLRQSDKWRLILYPVDDANSWIGWVWVD